MNPKYLPTEMNSENQERILRELQTLPGKLLLLKQKYDEKMKEMYALDVKVTELEYELEAAKQNAANSPEFSALSNDAKRKAFIFNFAQDIELSFNNLQRAKIEKEADILPVKSEYDLTYQKLWALRIVSEQIAAYMVYASAGELP